MPKSSKKQKISGKAATPKSSANSTRTMKPASKTTTITKPSNPIIKEDPKALVPAKRKLGLRGAAPWAARHAAKHAAEARARAAEPAPPGSARAMIRVPTGAEEIKAKIAELHNQTLKIRNLRKRLEK